MTPTQSGPTTIRLVALREQYEQLKPRIDAAIASVISRSAFIAGPEVAAFERWFADFCGVRHAIGVSSGTTALELVLRALGAGPGDEIVTPANTFVAVGAAVAATGARPVFVDVDERTRNLDPGRLRHVITPRTKAIIPVHLYGRPAAMARHSRRRGRDSGDRRRRAGARRALPRPACRVAFDRGVLQFLSDEEPRRLRRRRPHHHERRHAGGGVAAASRPWPHQPVRARRRRPDRTHGYSAGGGAARAGRGPRRMERAAAPGGGLVSRNAPVGGRLPG